jgi:UDP-GlcNAc:undecaprenyl-phosphate GlcNAc-1-phosphate transferase
VVTIAAVTLGILAARYIGDPTQWPVIILAGIIAGAYSGFLPWNFYPQKMMPGYSGKSLAGYLLAVVSILAVAKVQTLLMVLAVPMADVGWSWIRRVVSGRSPVWGDRGHLHHKLLDWGWGKRRIAVFYWLITAISGVLALGLNSKQKFYTLVAAFLIIGAVVLWLSFWTSSKASDRGNGLKT